jgi:hypothetical protein
VQLFNAELGEIEAQLRFNITNVLIFHIAPEGKRGLVP